MVMVVCFLRVFLRPWLGRKKTKCIEVFGTLIAGTAEADSNSMRYGANIIAQLLDVTCEGKIDDPLLAGIFNKFSNSGAPWMNFGTSVETEGPQDGPDSFSSQVWKAGGSDSRKPHVVLEEAFHMVHQMGLAQACPSYFGFTQWGDDAQSVACRCMKEAQCNWYQHWESSGCLDINGKQCDLYNGRTGDLQYRRDEPPNGTIPGTCGVGPCSIPSCDCVEFFHKVYTTWLGNRFDGYNRMRGKLDEMEENGLNPSQAVEKLLSQTAQCSQLLVHMKDPKIRIPKQHIKETYQCGRDTHS